MTLQGQNRGQIEVHRGIKVPTMLLCAPELEHAQGSVGGDTQTQEELVVSSKNGQEKPSAGIKWGPGTIPDAIQEANSAGKMVFILLHGTYVMICVLISKLKTGHFLPLSSYF